jgi:hypothetical protein
LGQNDSRDPANTPESSLCDLTQVTYRSRSAYVSYELVDSRLASYPRKWLSASVPTRVVALIRCSPRFIRASRMPMLPTKVLGNRGISPLSSRCSRASRKGRALRGTAHRNWYPMSESNTPGLGVSEMHTTSLLIGYRSGTRPFGRYSDKELPVLMKTAGLKIWWSAQDYAPGLVGLKDRCATLTLALRKIGRSRKTRTFTRQVKSLLCYFDTSNRLNSCFAI